MKTINFKLSEQNKIFQEIANFMYRRKTPVPNIIANTSDCPCMNAKAEYTALTEIDLSKKSHGRFNEKVRHYKRPVEHTLSKEQLEHTTFIIGGLSPIHNTLVEAGMKNLGVKCLALPNADKQSSDLGREYGNNGYCNPAYFTSGNLIKYLQKLHAEGMSKEDIIENHVFLTIGCGSSPCRFGMYESQYRNALKNSGFDGFRIFVVEQNGGMDQELETIAMKFDLEFFLMLVNGLNIGDLINAMVYSIRPYEIRKGHTNEVLKDVMDMMYDVFQNKKKLRFSPFMNKVFSFLKIEGTALFMYHMLDQLFNNYYLKALEKVYEKFQTVEVDRLQAKPKVKLTGEFWATVTVNDGNYKMYPFLEKEGAEVKSEYVATYLTYLLSKNLLKLKDKRPLYPFGFKKGKGDLGNYRHYVKSYLTLYLGAKLFNREFERSRKAIGGTLHKLMNHKEMQEMTHEYYHTMLSGGEGYMEIAKTIHYHEHDLAHMVISVKPFGCMPSTLSDGVQVKIMEKHRNMNFIPIETSGDGEINAHSRVQMALFDARIKVKEELQQALAFTSRTWEEMKTFMDENPRLKNPFYQLPDRKGFASEASKFILHLHELMEQRNSTLQTS